MSALPIISAVFNTTRALSARTPAGFRAWSNRAPADVPADERRARALVGRLPAQYRQLIILREAMGRWSPDARLATDEEAQARQRARDLFAELRDQLRTAGMQVRAVLDEARLRNVITRGEQVDAERSFLGRDFGQLGLLPVAVVGVVALALVLGWSTARTLSGTMERIAGLLPALTPLMAELGRTIALAEPVARAVTATATAATAGAGALVVVAGLGFAVWAMSRSRGRA